MSHVLPTQAPRRLPGDGFWRKTWAMLVKEFIQLRRDRVSFAMIIMIPLVVLISILIGAELAGILGALAAIPVAGSIQVVLRDVLAARRIRHDEPVALPP